MAFILKISPDFKDLVPIQMETAEDIWSPRFQASEDVDTQYPWGENKAKRGHFGVFLHLSSGFHTSISTELFKWKLLLQLHTARAGKDTCPPMNIFPAL